MKQHAEDACESIDASFFSGDTFHDSKSLGEVKFYVERWVREIAAIEKMLQEQAKESE